MNTGERIRHLRGNLSQAEFAANLGVNKELIGKYERGLNTPGGDILKKMREVTGVSLNWLLTGDGDVFVQSVESRSSQYQNVDKVILELCIERVEDISSRLGRRFSSKKKAQLIAAVYELATNIQNDNGLTNNINQVAAHLIDLAG